jgi:hypothetical protein
MSYKVFVSHRMSEKDAEIIRQAARDLRHSGVDLYLAEDDSRYDNNIPEDIAAEIRGCDHFVVFYTKGAVRSRWVTREIDMATGCGKRRTYIVERGVELNGALADKRHIPLDRSNPGEAIAELRKHIARIRSQQFASGALLLLACAAVILYLSRKS